MPLIGFKKQFAAMVESGEKRQTVRRKRRDGRDPRSGDVLHLYTGLRTRRCRKLLTARCTATSSIDIDHYQIVITSRTGVRFLDGIDALNDFARRDGFTKWSDMLEWLDATHGLPFHGLLIEWEKKK